LAQDERFCRLVEEYQTSLLRMCYLHLQDLQEAEDAVQETFLKAYRSLNSFQGISSEKTWLMRIAINVCRDLRRSAWYRFVDRRVTLDSLPLPVSPPSEEHIALTTQIMKLPQKLMEAVLLYYYQNLNIREIARITGITPSAVSNRLVKARTRLKDALEGGEGHGR